MNKRCELTHSQVLLKCHLVKVHKSIVQTQCLLTLPQVLFKLLHLAVEVAEVGSNLSGTVMSVGFHHETENYDHELSNKLMERETAETISEE